MSKTRSLKHIALDLLAIREHSSKELYNKLTKHSDDHDEIMTVLEDLQNSKFLSNERFAESFINSKSKKYGSMKIKYMLREKAVSNDIINDIYEGSDIDEYKTAFDILCRKYKSLPKDYNEKAKYMRFLLGRGFNSDVVSSVLDKFIRNFDE
ncbi:MAG: regulatory protein RecX [Burkholderiales bacterium]|nr:regulatory protein RecX [Burkholderiales bacterium]